MATLEGTNREFKKFVGPYLNKVIQYISRPHKKMFGVCQHCGQEGSLDAAHRNGRSRINIIDMVLGSDDQNSQVSVELEKFIDRFKFEHDPIEKAFLALCKSCHQKYDGSGSKVKEHGNLTHSQSEISSRASTPEDVLPISLVPPRLEDFKARLLERREALIEILYSDGRVEHRPWIASRFDANSSVFGNLRSRPQFRQGRWQESGIIALRVRVSD